MNALSPISAKLSILIPRLASDADGEVVATARAIDRQLRKAGADWHVLASAFQEQPNGAPDDVIERDDFQVMADRLFIYGELNAKERNFVKTMRRVLARAGTAPSPKQTKWLRTLWQRECGDG